MNDQPKQSIPIKGLICPECNNTIISEFELTVGKIIECSSCVTECEIISVSPLKLAPLEEEK